MILCQKNSEMFNVEIIMKEMLEIQQKSMMFVNLLSEGESLSQNQLILLLQLKINGGMKATEIADFFHCNSWSYYIDVR